MSHQNLCDGLFKHTYDAWNRLKDTSTTGTVRPRRISLCCNSQPVLKRDYDALGRLIPAFIAPRTVSAVFRGAQGDCSNKLAGLNDDNSDPPAVEVRKSLIVFAAFRFGWTSRPSAIESSWMGKLGTPAKAVLLDAFNLTSRVLGTRTRDDSDVLRKLP